MEPLSVEMTVRLTAPTYFSQDQLSWFLAGQGAPPEALPPETPAVVHTERRTQRLTRFVRVHTALGNVGEFRLTTFLADTHGCISWSPWERARAPNCQ